MSECKWDPSKHDGEQCPVHGGGKLTKGQEVSYKGKKYKIGGFYKNQKLQDEDEFADSGINADFRGIQLLDENGQGFNINANQLDEESEVFDDDFEEEFEDDDFRAEKIVQDMEEYFTPSEISQIERYAEHYGVDADKLKLEIAKSFDKKSREEYGGTHTPYAKNDAMEEAFDKLVSGEGPSDKEAEQLLADEDEFNSPYNEHESDNSIKHSINDAEIEHIDIDDEILNIQEKLGRKEKFDGLNYSDNIPDVASAYVLPNGTFLHGNKEESHEHLNNYLGKNGVSDLGLMSINPSVYGSRVAKLETSGNQLSWGEMKAIEKLVDNLALKHPRDGVLDVNGKPYYINNFDEEDEMVKAIIKDIRSLPFKK